MYKSQKKILLSGYQKSRTWLFSGENLESMFEVAEKYARWILKSDKTIGNLLVIQEKSIKVIHAEKIRSFLALTSNSSSQKVVIISHFETMTVSAANALLKILEEGNQSATIIVITQHIHRIIATIRSRCFQLYFPPLQDRNKENTLIAQYKNLLETSSMGEVKCLISPQDMFKQISNKYSIFTGKLTETSLRALLCFTFNRVIKFHHGVLEAEVFPKEKKFIESLGQSAIFWHYRWMQISEVLSIPQELYVEKNYLLRVALAPEGI